MTSTESNKAPNQTLPTRVGVWRAHNGFTAEQAAEIEKLGFGTLWLGGSPGAELENVEPLLAATETLTVATGIVNIWSTDAAAVADSYHRIESRFPGRFLLGIGAGHPEHTGEYRKPYDALVDYLDVLDAADVPRHRRVLAALGPKVLRLSRDRAAGAHPYLTTPEHTRIAREILGPDRLLVPEQKVVLDHDVERGRAAGRDIVKFYLGLSNYVANLRRLGFDDEDVSGDGSNRLVDALAVHGDVATVAAGITAHLDAGADQVAVQVLPAGDDPLGTLRALATELAL